MLNLIIDWKVKEILFQGEIVKYEIRPLKASAFRVLTPYMNLGKDEDMIKMAMTGFEWQEKVAPLIFPEHVRNISGIQINGREITLQDVMEESMLSEIAIGIIFELITISSLKKEDVKNSEGQSGDIAGEEKAGK